MFKLMTVVGARPQFIKAAAFSRALNRNRDAAARITEHIVHTGQHFDADMSDVFFQELDIPEPAAALGIAGGSHGKSTGRMLEVLEITMQDLSPDMVLVYGDTNSTLAGALAAAKLHIPVAHVEAGLRSYNRKMPEEINRVLSDRISELLFCPSDHSARTLQGEGVTDGVFVVGDFMYDLYRIIADKTEPRSAGRPFALLTLHRAETTDDRDVLGGYLEGVAQCGYDVLFPVHPRTRKALEEYGMTLPDNVQAVSPLGYQDIVSALKGCAFVMTDSGGLQKEAYFAGRRCLTFRTETEWVELVEADANRLVPPNPESVAKAVEWAGSGLTGTGTLYGAGDAADKTVQHVADWLRSR